MFTQTLIQVVKLFLFMLLGYVLSVKKILPKETPKCFSMFLVWLACPALYIYTFATQFSPQMLSESARLIGISLICLAAALLLSILLKRAVSKDAYSQAVFTYSVCVPNFGYVGNVLVLALLGETALMKYQIFVMPVTVFMVTRGYAMLLERKTGIKGLLNPMIIAMLAGMTIGLLQIKLPQFVLETLVSASDCMGPVSMTLAGCVIAGFDLKKILSLKEIYITVGIKMIAMPALVILLSRVITMPAEYLSLLLLFQTLPVGLNSVVYPSTIGKDCSFGAGLAVISNVAALITIPLFLAYLGL